MRRTRPATPRRHAVLAGVLGAALALPPLGGVVAPSAAARPAPAPAATSISIRPLQPTLAPGHPGAVAGSLHVDGASPAGRPVALEARASGEQAFTPIGTATTGERGGVRLRVEPTVTTRYRWHYAGAHDARPQVSGVVVVEVRAPTRLGRRLPTTLSIRAVRRAVAPGAAGVVRGLLRSGRDRLVDHAVVLLARPADGAGWQPDSERRTGPDGRVGFIVRPVVGTSYRLAFAGSALFRAARSGVARIGVRPAVDIGVSPGQVRPGQDVAVTGRVTSEGSPVAGASVDLMARSGAGGAVWEVLGSTTTAADGSLSLTASPSATTTYRLRVRAATGVLAGRSAAVEVHVDATGTGYRLGYAGLRRAASTSATPSD